MARSGAPARVFESILSGGGAYLVLFLSVMIVLAGTANGLSVADVVDLGLVAVPAGIITLRRQVSPGVGVGCAVALVVAAAIGTWSLDPTAMQAGYAGWFFGAITFVLLGLTLYGRIAAAWIAMAAMFAIAVSWAGIRGPGAAVGVTFVDRHVATLIVGTLFALVLQRSERRQAGFTAMERRERAAERAAEVRAGARRDAAEAVLEQAGPLLRAIASGRSLDHAERQELLVVEGSLRDGMRAPALVLPVLVTSVASARRRGVNVLLLDESAAASGTDERAAAAVWLAAELDDVAEGRFVGRVRDLEDGGLRVTTVTDIAGHARTIPPARRDLPVP